MLKIMFLCTGNSCRSQMAEGIAKELGKGKIEAYSAGSSPAGFVHPKAICAMEEIGIDISSYYSKPIDKMLLEKMDIVITVCGDAADVCPLTPPHIKKFHWGLPDPANKAGREEEITMEFRKIRDEIKEKIEDLIRRVCNV